KGYEAANERSGVLQRLRLSDEEWKQYLAQRESRLVKTIPTPQFVEVKVTSTDVARDIQKDLPPFVNKPMETPSLEDELARQVGFGRLGRRSDGLIDRG